METFAFIPILIIGYPIRWLHFHPAIIFGASVLCRIWQYGLHSGAASGLPETSPFISQPPSIAMGNGHIHATVVGFGLRADPGLPTFCYSCIR